MYLVVKYENKSVLQPLDIVFKSKDLNIAKKKAYDLSREIYGLYVEVYPLKI